MRTSDLRSNPVRALIYTFAFISALGFLIPITANFIDEQITIDLIGVDKSSSVGMGIIMVATTGGIGMAFVMRRRGVFKMYENYYCKKSGEKMYEDEDQERLFCPSHGEVKIDFWESDERHYAYKEPSMSISSFIDKHKQPRMSTKKDLEHKITQLEDTLERLSRQTTFDHRQPDPKRMTSVDSAFEFTRHPDKLDVSHTHSTGGSEKRQSEED
jgi:uncharacterized Zn finger protein (UPF0148 family)